jgi:hypothetical protein
VRVCSVWSHFSAPFHRLLIINSTFLMLYLWSGHGVLPTKNWKKYFQTKKICARFKICHLFNKWMYYEM